MDFEKTDIEGCFVVSPQLLEDERGWFTRTFCDKEFGVINKQIVFKQINQSFNKKKGTFRGMHYQAPPFTEEKLIRCITGSILDVILDLRKGSPTFLKHIFVPLSAENMKMLFVPKGVAHGFLTMEDNTNILYHHTVEYVPEAACGVRYNDPVINIIPPAPIHVISTKDCNFELIDSNFEGLTI